MTCPLPYDDLDDDDEVEGRKEGQLELEVMKKMNEKRMITRRHNTKNWQKKLKKYQVY